MPRTITRPDTAPDAVVYVCPDCERVHGLDTAQQATLDVPDMTVTAPCTMCGDRWEVRIVAGAASHERLTA